MCLGTQSNLDWLRSESFEKQTSALLRTKVQKL